MFLFLALAKHKLLFGIITTTAITITTQHIINSPKKHSHFRAWMLELDMWYGSVRPFSSHFYRNCVTQKQTKRLHKMSYGSINNPTKVNIFNTGCFNSLCGNRKINQYSIVCNNIAKNSYKNFLLHRLNSTTASDGRRCFRIVHRLVFPLFEFGRICFVFQLRANVFKERKTHFLLK